MCSRRHAILHLPSKFSSNQTIAGGVMASSIFQGGGHRVGNLLSGSDLVVHLFKEVEVYLSAKF